MKPEFQKLLHKASYRLEPYNLVPYSVYRFESRLSSYRLLSSRMAQTPVLFKVFILGFFLENSILNQPGAEDQFIDKIQ